MLNYMWNRTGRVKLLLHTFINVSSDFALFCQTALMKLDEAEEENCYNKMPLYCKKKILRSQFNLSYFEIMLCFNTKLNLANMKVHTSGQ